MEEKLPKEDTIKKWISKKGKREFEKDIDYRLKFIEEEYIKKKNKLLYIKEKLKHL
jgi:repressor of nif and glnA expression